MIVILKSFYAIVYLSTIRHHDSTLKDVYFLVVIEKCMCCLFAYLAFMNT